MVITGVARGLGKAMARGFAEQGHRVAGCSRNGKKLVSLEEELGDLHSFKVLDVKKIIWNKKSFSNKIDSFGTAIPNNTKSFNIEKYEILSPIEFNKNVKKDEIIAKLKSRNILAPFDGVVGKRNFSDDILVSESSIVINIEDASVIFIDLDIPEIYAPVIKKQLPVEITFSGYKNKIYMGEIESFASRINVDTRTLSARVKLVNKNLEILPGSLLEVTIKYNNRNSLSIPDTSVILEGNKVYVYKVLEENIAKKSEIQIGTRNLGNLEVISGLSEGDLIVAEGLKKVRPGSKIKPIKN